ncbi:hypothetical protein cypCar_00024194 [Cyprinus carpio]|nr:hypothetical protein cypCar_00024194 [Cyprinus carpio]
MYSQYTCTATTRSEVCVCVSEESYERELKLEMSSEVYDCMHCLSAGQKQAENSAAGAGRCSMRERSWPDQLIRKTYEEDFFIQMMQESYELWAQLEREAGVELYSHLVNFSSQAHRPVDYGPRERRGFLTPKGHDAKAQVPTVFLEKQELSHHIPNVTLTDANRALTDTHAGVLYADRVTPDHNFVLDSHPIYGNIIISAGFSGQYKH